MNSWKVILATMVIFGAGVITGGLLVKSTSATKRVRQPRTAAGTNALPRSFGQAQIQRMEFLVRANRELSLTPEQRERIERILREGQEKTRKLWDGVAPEMRKELQLVRERIKVELTPEQRRRFEQLMRRPRANRLQNSGERLPDGSPRQPRRDILPPSDHPPLGAPESLPPGESDHADPSSRSGL